MPEVFHVNWFRKSSEGKFLWPGFGENVRVLEWIFDRCGETRRRGNASETAVGYVPKKLNIEGLSEDNSHPVQQAWIAEQVPQCGYCQSGQILTAVALLSRDRNPSDEKINRMMNGLCRCGTYPRIKKAIKKAGKLMEV